MGAQEAVREHAALEIASDLTFDETRDGRVCGASPRQNGHELTTNHFVEQHFLGLVADVAGDGRASAGTASTRRAEQARAAPGCRQEPATGHAIRTFGYGLAIPRGRSIASTSGQSMPWNTVLDLGPSRQSCRKISR